MRCRILVPVAVCVFLGVCYADEPEEPRRVISVTGTAVTQTVPDIISWHISTTDESKELVAAKESSDEKMRAILELCKELGVANEDIQTGNLHIEREYHRDEKGNRLGFKQFALRRSVTARQRDLSRFDEYLTKLVSRADVEANFNFESSQACDLRWETRLKALKAAQKKAADMLQVVGAELGDVVSIEEPRERRPDYASNVQYYGGGEGMPDVIGGTLAPGAIEVKVTVYATFAIR